jgi:hypothetical protein
MAIVFQFLSPVGYCYFDPLALTPAITGIHELIRHVCTILDIVDRLDVVFAITFLQFEVLSLP